MYLDLEKFDSSDRKIITNTLSASVKGAWNVPAYKRYLSWRGAYLRAKSRGLLKREKARLARMKEGTWNGKQEFFTDIERGIWFPIELKHRLKAIGLRIKVVRQFKIPKETVQYPLPKFPKVSSKQDYSFQEQVVKMFESRKRFYGLFHLAPNAGKSEIIAKLCLELGLPAIITAPSKVTTQNIYDRLVKYFGHNYVGIWMGNKRRLVKNGIMCVSWPSLRGSKEYWMYTVPVWISDEAHRELLAQSQFNKMSRAYYRIGLSGTLSKNKMFALKVESMFGPESMRITEKELEDKGISAKATHYFHEVRAPKHFKEKRAEKLSYPAFYRKYIAANFPRNKKVVDICKAEVAKGRRGLVFVRARDHGIRLQRMLKKAGLCVRYVHGETHDKHMKEAQDGLREGTIDVLVGTTVINTGLSINEIQFTVSAVGEISPFRRLQEVGRGARRKAIHNRASHHDFWDSWSVRTLEHSRKRWRTIKSTGSILHKVNL